MKLDLGCLETPTLMSKAMAMETDFPSDMMNSCPSGGFSIPAVTDIDNFEREVVDLVKPQHGTTTLGFIFKGGVIVAVDSRATMGPYVCACTPSASTRARAAHAPPAGTSFLPP
mmetsp:Transcript_19436/g.61876  ORF Transcript_19436/g.61876 Transcript_19436/m.61876 type:complete len:114 (+) Transcript_19436:163-504(+)